MNDVRDPDTPHGALSPRAPHEIRAERLPHPFSATVLVSALRRRFRVFVAIFVAVLALAVVTILVQPPYYTAVAEVVLDPTAGMVERPTTARTTGELAGREIQIIKSREMASAVASALRLDGRLIEDNPSFAKRIRAMFLGPSAHSPADRQRQIVDRLIEGLTIDRLQDTYSLAIGYSAADPGAAARIVNEYAVQYSSGRLAGAGAEASPLDRPYARIISRAEPPLSHSSPRPLPTLALGALIGAFVGAVGAVIIERRFSGITSGGETEKRLGLPHLGSVPTLNSLMPGASSPLEAIVSSPLSGFAEAFRGVMMAIRHVGGRGTQVIAITSALPNEGKTTVAACLARSIALGGETVVLIDCDTRRRDTSALFGQTERRPGLIEVLRYEATLDEALIRDEESGAWILPVTGPVTDVSDLVGGTAMIAVIEDLKTRFKRILIDTAPILAMSSTRAIVTMADLVAVVVRWRSTADHAVLSALRLLPHEHVRIGGVILSQVDVTKQVKFGHGDPMFYYKQYSEYYS